MRWPVFLLVALIGLGCRLPQLGGRPMHTDEAVNAYIVGQLLAGEPFHYDPQDRHGPALSALALPLARMQGATSFSALTERELRLTSVVAGTIMILLFGAAVEIFGLVPCAIAALLFAVGPLPVYYDRYFIHESLFCAATFGLMLSAWRAFARRSTAFAILAGACAGLMVACKETAVLHLFALAVAAVVFKAWDLRKTKLGSISLGPLLVTFAAFLAPIVVLFTWFGRDWRSLVALFHVAPNVMARAGGQGHQQPFWYFAKLLTSGWSGGVLVGFACVGLIVAMRRQAAPAYRFLLYYGLTLTMVYSLIPYKTPWLALNLWLPLALFAGIAAVWLYGLMASKLGKRIAVAGVCVVGMVSAVLIGRDTRQRVFLHPADETNPYAYAHTSEDILGLPDEIAEMAKRDGISTPRIAVIASDPWPLPWYLRRFQQVGYWQPGQQVPDADFYVTSTDAANQYAERLRGLRGDFFGSRPGVLVLLWMPTPK